MNDAVAVGDDRLAVDRTARAASCPTTCTVSGASFTLSDTTSPSAAIPGVASTGTGTPSVGCFGRSSETAARLTR